MKRNLIAICIGLLIVIASWAPLWIVEATDRYSMPVGLGLLAIAGSLVGGMIALVGFIRLLLHVARAAKKP